MRRKRIGKMKLIRVYRFGSKVRLRIRVGDFSVVTSALVNSGFESDEAELILPPPLADVLGVGGTDIAEYRVAGGGVTLGARISEELRVSLVLEDRELCEVPAVGTVLPGEDEVIVSDKLASTLGIVILDPYEGLRCLRDELGKKVRRSVGPQVWR